MINNQNDCIQGTFLARLSLAPCTKASFNSFSRSGAPEALCLSFLGAACYTSLEWSWKLMAPFVCLFVFTECICQTFNRRKCHLPTQWSHGSQSRFRPEVIRLAAVQGAPEFHLRFYGTGEQCIAHATLSLQSGTRLAILSKPKVPIFLFLLQHLKLHFLRSCPHEEESPARKARSIDSKQDVYKRNPDRE